MIPILYESTEQKFASNGLGRLSDAVSCIVEEERNGAYELTMEYPVRGIHFSDIQRLRIISAVPSDGKDRQPFDIYFISKPVNGRVTVQARHISYRLSKIPTVPADPDQESASAAAALLRLKSEAAEDCPFEFWSDNDTQGSYTTPVPASIRSRLGGVTGSVLDSFGGEYEWDGWTVKLHASRGADKSVTLRYGKNITDITQEESIENTVTGILPYWHKDADTDNAAQTVTGDVVYCDNYENYPYHMTAVVDFSQEYQSAPTKEQLEERAKTYVKANDVGVPDVNLKVSFAALWQTEEYKDIAPLERVNLCDTVRVEFPSLGVSAKAKVIKTTYNVLKERYDSIELGNSRTNLAQQITGISQDAEESRKKSESFLRTAINTASNLIRGGLGGHVIFNTDGNGRPNEILIMDTEDKSTAVKVLRINMNGIGFSKTGYDGPFETAWTLDGTFDADWINAGIIKAGLIKAGILQDEAGKNSWNMETGELHLSSESTVGGSEIINNETLTARQKEILETASKDAQEKASAAEENAKSDADTKLLDYYTQTQVDEKAGELTTKISETYTTLSEFNSLAIGGRNLLRGTREMKGDDSGLWAAGTFKKRGTQAEYNVTLDDPPVQGVKGISMTSNGTWAITSGQTGLDLLAGKKVTLSVWVKGPKGGEFCLRACGAASDLKSYTISDTGWTRYSVTNTVPSGYTSGSFCAYMRCMYDNNEEEGKFYIAAPMMEYGTVPSDWRPAPEDSDDYTDSQLEGYYTKAEVQSQIDQKAGEITSTVSETYITKEAYSQEKGKLWYGYGTPYEKAYPSEAWSKDEEIDHVGDTYYDMSTGNQYRFAFNGASGPIAFTFSEDSETYSSSLKDYVQFFYEINGNLFMTSKYDGTKISGATVYIPSSTFWMLWHVESGTNRNKYGFKVSSVSAATGSQDIEGARTEVLPSTDSVVECGDASDSANWPETAHPYSGNTSVLYKFSYSGTLNIRIAYVWDLVSTSINKSYIESEINQKADEINLSVEEKLEDYYTKSEIDVKADSIESVVSKKVGTDELSTKIRQDAESVRIAWSSISNYIKFENAQINVYDGNNNGIISFNQNGMEFWCDSYYLGYAGTSQWTADNTKKGIVFNLSKNGAYMLWGTRSSDSGTYDTVFGYFKNNTPNTSSDALNAFRDLNMHNYYIRNIGGTITKTLEIPVFIKAVNSSTGTITSISTNCSLKFENGLLTGYTWPSESAS